MTAKSDTHINIDGHQVEVSRNSSGCKTTNLSENAELITYKDLNKKEF